MAEQRPPPSPYRVIVANWRGDATIVSVSGNAGCGWGLTVGETRQGVAWYVATDRASFVMYEDVPNYPTDGLAYTGPLTGAQFDAMSTDGGGGVCRFRGSTIHGTFSADFTTFEADETLVWGPPSNETRVQRHWLTQSASEYSLP